MNTFSFVRNHPPIIIYHSVLSFVLIPLVIHMLYHRRFDAAHDSSLENRQHCAHGSLIHQLKFSEDLLPWYNSIKVSVKFDGC